jgi:hypothetical protein
MANVETIKWCKIYKNKKLRFLVDNLRQKLDFKKENLKSNFSSQIILKSIL